MKGTARPAVPGELVLQCGVAAVLVLIKEVGMPNVGLVMISVPFYGLAGIAFASIAPALAGERVKRLVGS